MVNWPLRMRCRASVGVGFLPLSPILRIGTLTTGCYTNCWKRIELRMVGPAGLEPATPDLEGRCSIQMSYEPLGSVYGKLSDAGKKRDEEHAD
jgi:hypothetical protein